jgi:HDOD domain
MLSHTELNVVRFAAGRGQPSAVRGRRLPALLGSHPVVPVLPVTLAQLDLLLSRPALDLEEISETILTDVGATLQIFRTAATTVAVTGWRARRISECVVHLGQKRLQGALESWFPAVSMLHDEAAKGVWERAKLTAKISMLLARQVPELPPESAYLAGLLHEVGRLPAILGWYSEALDLGDPFTVGCAVIREWGLPTFLESSFLVSPTELRSASPLAGIVAAAWDIANRRCRGQSVPVTVLPGSPRPLDQSGETRFALKMGTRGQLFLVQ